MQEFDGADDSIICPLWDEKCSDKMKRLLYNSHKFTVYSTNLLQKVNLPLSTLKIESLSLAHQSKSIVSFKTNAMIF